MSTSPDTATLVFIRELHKLGASRVKVGEVEVEFGEQAAMPAAPVEPPTAEELRKQAEALLYASSD